MALGVCKNVEHIYELQDKKSVNNLNKEIRKSLYNTKRQSVRRKIVQGNSKTLWDATKIAMDKECTEIPDTIIHGQDIHKGEEIPEAFAKYFKAKVADIVDNTTIQDGVFNGTRQITAVNEFFMTDLRVLEIMSTLKIKNCEGIDRLPLRILNDGAEILAKPMAKLFKLIYDQKEVPAQWKMAKIIPTHKKGTRDNVANYRPISNLCAISKIYLRKMAESSKVDLTGDSQHGFKKERSTVTAALHLQSIIARALDSNNYYVLSSLDLSSAFDIVNRELLL